MNGAPAPAPGSAAGGRAARVAGLLDGAGLDQLYVSDLTNVRYLSGFTGTNGACLLGRSEAIFFTDFRYVERAAEEVGEGWERPEAERELLPKIARRMSGRVGFEDSKLSVRQHASLAEAVPDDVELVAAGDLVEGVRAIKEPGELDLIRAAAELTDDVYRELIEAGLMGRTELEVASTAVAAIRGRGAEPSFPPIVAGGANGAQPHAEPGDRKIGPGELVVFDMGSELGGYCSDCTRTFSTGGLSERATAIYEVVREAQAAAAVAVMAGAEAAAVDGVAREIIGQAGYGEQFGHGLGHGVGMDVHEAPRLGQGSKDVLAEGNVVTVEPGIYVAGELGVRIEDLMIVTADGGENLSGLPKDLTEVG